MSPFALSAAMAHCRLLGLLTALGLLVGTSVRADIAPVRRVLLLSSFGHEFAPYEPVISTFKTKLALHSSEPLEFNEVGIEMARFSEAAAEEALVQYIRALFADRDIDLVVPVGGAAVRFWERHHDVLFPATPTVLAGIDQRRLPAGLSSDHTAVYVHLDLPGAIDDILRVLPRTERIAVVFGATPLEKLWVEEARREWQRHADRVRLVWWNELPVEEIRQRAANLPPRSAILYMMMSVDARSVPYEGERALTIIHETANAPIFGLFTFQLGRGIVGGRLIDGAAVGQLTEEVATRILAGEPPGGLRIPPIEPGAPQYDGRELRRWGISRKALPPNSTVLYETPSMWERHRSRILIGLIIIAVQGLAVVGLLIERAHRRRAEVESRERGRELLHATRQSTLGELTSSLAHELHQPLGAILRNAEAAEMLLQRTPPDIEEVQAILADIRQDDARATRVIDHLRTLLRRGEVASSELVIEDLFDEAREIVEGDAIARGIAITWNVPLELPPIRGNRVHLVQVLLNLISNAVDASKALPVDRRRISVRATRIDVGVEIAVIDVGHGIPAGDLDRLFRPFHSTKSNSLGLGLSICRTIVEAHGGRILASNNPDGGATFRFTLPPATVGARA